MTSVFASRRRAEEFHSLVETPATGSSADVRHADLLELVGALRAVPVAEPRPEFVASLRAELMTAADTLLLPADRERLSLPARSSRRDRRIAAAIGGIAVVGASTSMAVAAQTALPGEMLYPLKRAIEDAETGVASGDDARALTLLDGATSRLAELEELGQQGDLDDGRAVSDNVADFAARAREATGIIIDDYDRTGDPDLVRQLRDFTGSSMTTLEDLRRQVPEASQDDVVAAMDVVNDIDAQAVRACPSCGGTGVEEIPPVLLSAATDASVVVIPGATVKAWQPRDDGRSGRGGDGRGEGRSGGQRNGDQQGSDDSLVTAPDTGTGGGEGEDPTGDPVKELTNTLTGGEDPTASTTGGSKIGKTVEDTVDGVKKGVKDATDDLGGSLLD